MGIWKMIYNWLPDIEGADTSLDRQNAYIHRWNTQVNRTLLLQQDIKERQAALESYNWLTPEQKARIVISEFWVQIEGIGTFNLYDEPWFHHPLDSKDIFRECTPAIDDWEKILNFLHWSKWWKLTGRKWFNDSESEEVIKFIREVLKMERQYYITFKRWKPQKAPSWEMIWDIFYSAGKTLHSAPVSNEWRYALRIFLEDGRW